LFWKELKFRGELLLFKIFRLFITKTSLKGRERFLDLLSSLLVKLMGNYRRVVKKNLEIAFGREYSEENWRRVTKSCIRNLLSNMATIVDNLSRTPEETSKIVKFENREVIDKILGEGKSIIFSSGHLSNWELLATSITTQIANGNGVVEKLRNPRMDRILSASRNRMGVTTIPMGGALRQLIKAIKRGENIMMLIDQSVNRGQGVEYPLFGFEAIHSDTNRFLSEKYDIYIAPVYIRFENGEYFAKFEEPFKASEVENSLATELSLLENSISNNRENWLWCHRRWKNHKGIYK
jgi:KDO2-lipid IV(A) lauroyltransferase